MYLHTMEGEVVEFRHVPCRSVGVSRVWQTGAWIPQLVKEGVHHGVDS